MCNTTEPVDALKHVELLIKTFDRRTIQPQYLATGEGRAFHEGRETGLFLAAAAIRAERLSASPRGRITLSGTVAPTAISQLRRSA
jgi:hypothetical protein